jgi:hypothetical protein
MDRFVRVSSFFTFLCVFTMKNGMGQTPPIPFFPKESVEKHLFAVIPAKAGIPKRLKPMDSRLRGNDSEVEMLH